MNTRNWSIALVSSAIALVAAVSPALSETVEITANDINVRSGAGINYGVITVWNKGVRGNRIKQEKNWSYIVTGPVEDWVSSLYVKPVATSGNGSTQPTYEATGAIDNARYKGKGVAEAKVVGNNATVRVFSQGENVRLFSTIYYGKIYSNSGSLIKISLNAFESTRIGIKFSTTGECQLSLNNRQIKSLVCQAAGVDHGRTVFTGDKR
ncbi:MAG: SH3 domain-containing protein [Stenomitos frigidus ULC029]